MADQLELGLATTPAPPRAGRAPPTRRRRSPSVEPPQLDFVLDEDEAEPSPDPVPSIRGTVRIETIARQVLGPKVMVSLTTNRSTMISCTRKRGVTYLRIHAIFADAPNDVIIAAARYDTGEPTKARDDKLIDDWIESCRHLVKKPARDRILQPHGEAHDLGAMFDRLNAEYFGGKIVADITWSKSLRNKRRHSIRLGSYDDEQKLIRIHPAMDQAFVPAYFVESVVFHEMLHQVHETPEHNGRREVHTAEFYADERTHTEYERARRWEAKHLSRLLRY